MIYANVHMNQIIVLLLTYKKLKKTSIIEIETAIK